MRTLIIDNYPPNSPQIENLYSVVRTVAVHTVEVREYSSIHAGEEFSLFDAIVLSGSPRMLAEPGLMDEFMQEVEFLRFTDKPLLGICFGHQLMARAFGADVVDMGEAIKGYYMVERRSQDEIFDGLADRFVVCESHREMVAELPFDFSLLAMSPNCPVEAMKHNKLPLYGLQFHPERFDDGHPAGRSILANFFTLASWYMK